VPTAAGIIRRSTALLLGALLLAQEPVSCFAQVRFKAPSEPVPASSLELPAEGLGVQPGPSPFTASPDLGQALDLQSQGLPTRLTAERAEGTAQSRVSATVQSRPSTGESASARPGRSAVQNAVSREALDARSPEQPAALGRIFDSGAARQAQAIDAPGGSGLGAAPSEDASGYRRALIKSFWWYGTDRVLHYYKDYRESVAKNAEPAVRSPKGFVAALRVFGTDGEFAPLGFKTASREEVEVDAFRIYDKFVDAGPEAREAFARLVERAKTFNPNKRETNFRKLLRHALMDAATTPVSKLPAYYDSQLTDKKREDVEKFQAAEMGRRYEAFKKVVNYALASEPTGPGRPIAIVLLGSYVNRAATPSSDFDFEVVTDNGRYGRVPEFAARIKKMWKELGESPDDVSAVTYALPPSAAILSRIHREPYEVLTVDPAVAAQLDSQPSGQSRRSAWGPVLKHLHWAMAYATMFMYDLGHGLPPGPMAKGSSGASDADGARGPPAGASAALWSLLIQRTLSISAFIVTLIAFPMLVRLAPGVSFAELMAVSTVATIGANPIAGRLVDKIGIRSLIAYNNVLRIAIYGISALLVTAHGLNFVTLLALAALNGINTGFTTNFESSLVSHFWGRNTRTGGKVNATLQFNYLGLQVLLGTFFGVGRTVDRWGFLPTYGVAASLVGGALVTGLFIPNVRVERNEEAAAASRRSWTDVIKEHGLGALVFLGAGLGYLWARSPLLPIAGLMFWISRTSSFRVILKDRELRVAMLFMGLIGILFQPVQGLIVPTAAAILAPHAAGIVQGHLLGALFIGQLLASAHVMQLDGKVRKAVLAGLMGLFGVWSYLQLFPGSLPMAALTVGVTSVLSYILSKFTNRTWLKFMGLGLAFVWLPYLAWGTSSLLISLAMIGLFYSPVWVTLLSRFQKRVMEVAPERRGSILGVQGAFFSASIALGYALLGIDLAHLSLPAGLLPIGLAYAAASLVLVLGPRWLKGLSTRYISKLGYKDQPVQNDGPHGPISDGTDGLGRGAEGPGTSRTSDPQVPGPFTR
jgi:predicted nucleotidyltransferase